MTTNISCGNGFRASSHPSACRGYLQRGSLGIDACGGSAEVQTAREAEAASVGARLLDRALGSKAPGMSLEVVSSGVRTSLG